MRPARRLRLRPSRCQSRTRAATPLQWRRRIARSPVRFFGGGPSPLPSMLAFLAGALALCSVQSTGAPGGHAKRQVCTKASSVHQARQCHRAGPAGLLRQALAAPAEQRSHGAAPRDRSPSAARRLCFGDDPPQSPTAVAMTAPAAQSTPSAASPSRTASTGDLVCFGVDDLAAAADPPAESAAAPSSTPVAATTCSTGPRPAAWQNQRQRTWPRLEAADMPRVEGWLTAAAEAASMPGGEGAAGSQGGGGELARAAEDAADDALSTAASPVAVASPVAASCCDEPSSPAVVKPVSPAATSLSPTATILASPAAMVVVTTPARSLSGAFPAGGHSCACLRLRDRELHVTRNPVTPLATR